MGRFDPSAFFIVLWTALLLLAPVRAYAQLSEVAALDAVEKYKARAEAGNVSDRITLPPAR